MMMILFDLAAAVAAYMQAKKCSRRGCVSRQ
jgi:hypothetical protein